MDQRLVEKSINRQICISVHDLSLSSVVIQLNIQKVIKLSRIMIETFDLPLYHNNDHYNEYFVLQTSWQQSITTPRLILLNQMQFLQWHENIGFLPWAKISQKMKKTRVCVYDIIQSDSIRSQGSLMTVIAQRQCNGFIASLPTALMAAIRCVVR